eukprot:TRINITY_DN74294_c0_g1_i1.p1 TRINITY_DN74294_c0_g1~~TRINITY_DN74294_c0_g1_i1.p1  ORF type:complete len:242 (-),score=40.36 TRINITY_DN74294_c0_g1_i1:320-1006(-)
MAAKRKREESSKVSGNCRRMFGDAGTRDTVLLIGEKEERFEAHFGVLASYVPWFACASSAQMTEAATKQYKFPEDSVEGWEALLGRMYPPNDRIGTSHLLQVLPLVDKYNVEWLLPEIREACKSLPTSDRSVGLFELLFRLKLCDIIDLWIADESWLTSIRSDPGWIDGFQTMEPCKYFLKGVMRAGTSSCNVCMLPQCSECQRKIDVASELLLGALRANGMILPSAR